METVKCSPKELHLRRYKWIRKTRKYKSHIMTCGSFQNGLKIFENYLWRSSYLTKFIKTWDSFKNLPKYIPEYLQWAVHYFVIISWNSQLFLSYFFIRLLSVRNSLNNNLLNANNKKNLQSNVHLALAHLLWSCRKEY